MTPSQMLLETFDSLMVILVKLDQRITHTENHSARIGEKQSNNLSVKEDITHTKTLIGRYYGACKAAEAARPFVPGIPSHPWPEQCRNPLGLSTVICHCFKHRSSDL